MTTRAWRVAGSHINGLDRVPDWVSRDYMSFLTSRIADDVRPGMTLEEAREIVSAHRLDLEGWQRLEISDPMFYFLSEMQVDDIVVTLSQGKFYVGLITGEPLRDKDPRGEDELRRSVNWLLAESQDELPKPIREKFVSSYGVIEVSQFITDFWAPMLADFVVPQPQAVSLPDATDELAAELHVSRSWLQEVIDLLADRPQLILYGPPGTGKTFIAQRLARFLTEDDPTHLRLVQFHPAYAYEDFFEGFRPKSDGGFELKAGPLKRLAVEAANNPKSPYFLIIDEINRGNIAKIFGELYFLLEYRDQSIELLYSDELFTLPPNVFIIGTMNTADRSIALVDAAMRRRFSFVPLHPAEPPTKDLLRNWLIANDLPIEVADLLDELNARIDDAEFQIGPSYFMHPQRVQGAGLERVWRTSILPQLEEHHFGQLSRSEVAQRYSLPQIRATVARRAATAQSIVDQPDELM